MAARLVAAIARLDECVGAEAHERLRRHQLGELALVGDVVEVVHALVALVAHPAALLELLRTRHARHRSAGHVQFRSCYRWPKEALKCRGDQVPTASSGVVGVNSPGGPAAALAANHLQGPRTVTLQLDHLLSLVREMVPARRRR